MERSVEKLTTGSVKNASHRNITAHSSKRKKLQPTSSNQKRAKTFSKYLRRGAILILTLLLLAIIIYRFSQPSDNSPANNSSITPKTPVIFFAGKPITSGEIDANGLTQVKSLIQQGIYTESAMQKQRINNYSLSTAFDNIEIEKQLKLYNFRSIDKLINFIAPPSMLSENAIYQFYIAHPELFTRSPARIHVREIMMKDQDVAYNVLNQLHSGVPFEQLAKRYSVDPQQYRDSGGDMGWVTEKQMPWEWNQIAFSLSVNEISSVFKVESFYCIVQLIEGPKYDVIPYNLVSTNAKALATAYQQKQRFLIWLTSKILQEPVVVLQGSYTAVVKNVVNYLHENPDQGVS